MPVEQPVLDTNYKQLKTIITIAIIVAYRGENNIKCLREKANKQKQNRVVGGEGGEVIRVQNN